MPPAPRPPLDPDQFQRIAKALSDPRRFEMLEHIANAREMGCQKLCGEFPVTQATVSHHMKELANAGLIEPCREGQFVSYRMRHDVLQQYLGEMKRRLTAGRRG